MPRIETWARRTGSVLQRKRPSSSTSPGKDANSTHQVGMSEKVISPLPKPKLLGVIFGGGYG
ncbi:hypothetical protein N7537_011390 [Penicillium hordei]|uniref:Uncharacterized protein n=1 Tax=Penicillium hordei TaxID=40994 RepID=A0AAD6DLR2_9EURO|nr:uncharacterized protein N7537_011390 [Penicillium hordei]KAJ5588712.1 hypothetical protein N7537_011390 [Penicillium hordei]